MFFTRKNAFFRQFFDWPELLELREEAGGADSQTAQTTHPLSKGKARACIHRAGTGITEWSQPLVALVGQLTEQFVRDVDIRTQDLALGVHPDDIRDMAASGARSGTPRSPQDVQEVREALADIGRVFHRIFSGNLAAQCRRSS